MFHRGFPRFHSIRSKLYLSFFGVAILPLAALGIVGPLLYAQSVERQYIEQTQQMIGQVTRSIEFYIRDMEYLIDFIALQSEVRKFLSAKNAASSGEETLVSGLLDHLRISRPEIAGLLVVNRYDRMVGSELDRISRDPLTSESWYKLAIEEPDRIRLIPRPVGRNVRNRLNFSADDVVSVVKALRDPVTHDALGVIVIDMRLEVFEGLFSQATVASQGFLCVTDANGGFVYAPNAPVVYRLDPLWFQPFSGSVVGTIQGRPYQILSQASAYTGWTVVGVFSLTEALKEVTALRFWTLGVALACLAFALFTAISFTSSFTRPVIRLRGVMKKAQEGDLDARFDHGPDDEIGQLGSSFNTMLGEIRKLIDLVYDEQKQKREAELKTLQAQIKPHFLYNTLDTIQWMASQRGAEDIVTVVGALGDLFRIGLSKGKELIPLVNELEHTRNYLVIQKTRYEDKLSYEIDQTPVNPGRPVLKLILQPLVENAIYHGLKEKDGPGEVRVWSREEGGVLILTVEDNGAGIDEDRLAALRERLEAGETGEGQAGYGLFNVQARLRLSFGARFGLRVDSAKGRGTRLEVIHPLLTEDEEC